MAAIQTCFRRYEKKYLLTPAQQEFILHGARGYMKEDAYGRYTICNIYYDTEDYSLIRSSLDKPVYKEKLRVRSYGTPQPQEDVFVEIKKKVDGIVYKRRVKLAAGLAPRYLADDLALSPGGQISREIEWFQRFHRTQPRVFIGYDRMALAGTEQSELRMTFDTNLRWRDTALDLRAGGGGELLLPPEQVLMELKIPDAAPLWLGRLLSEAGAYPVSFSKYGLCYREHIVPAQADGFEKEALYSA